MIKIKIIEKTLNKGEIIPLTFDPIFTNIFNNEENICILEDFISIYFDIPINEVIVNLKILSRKLNKNNKLELEKYLEGGIMREESKEKLIKNVERYSSDEDVFTLYTELSKSELEKNTMIAEANDEGFKNVLVVGEKRGISEKNTQIAKSMYHENIDLGTISRVTNLGITELQGMFNIN